MRSEVNFGHFSIQVLIRNDYWLINSILNDIVGAAEIQNVNYL